MKILKSTLVVMLLVALLTSCTVDDIAEDPQTNEVAHMQAKGDKVKEVTKKKKKKKD